MGNVRREPLQAQPASVSRIVSLTRPDHSAAAKRFVRWRNKNRKFKLKKPMRVRYWQSRKPLNR
jgi:hypothetical protein